ncbi:MAG TPA: metallophosphoesterase [Polyangia bacterium]|nr:metallophosphoesterase [Polyangia bacterium]
MRVAFTSDLHVEHHPDVTRLLVRRLEALAPDILIVAGDISDDLLVVESTLRALRPQAARRGLFVPGNHELWTRGDGTSGAAHTVSSRERYLDALAEHVTAAGFDYLPAGPVVEAGVGFVGQTGWFDYSLRNRAHDAAISLEVYRRKRFGALRWNDGVRVRWPDGAGLLDDPDLSAWMVGRLQADLAAVPGGARVVVTHHLPFPELVFVRGALPWDYLNAFLGSRTLGQTILRAPGVERVVCGHTHARRRAVLRSADGRRVVAETSPIGYPREYGDDLERRVTHRVSSFMI